MSTGQQIYDGSLAKSNQNNPEQNSAAEIIRRLNDRMDGLIHVAAIVNPIALGGSFTVVETSGVWTRSTDMLMVWRLQQESNGEEVVVVPIDDQQAEPSRLSVYELGDRFTAIPTSAGTPTGDMRIFGVLPATQINDLALAIDTRFPSTFDELLVLEVAIDLAVKDGRIDEEAYLIQDRNAWLQRWVAHLQTRTTNTRRRFGNRQVINIEQLTPFLAGSS